MKHLVLSQTNPVIRMEVADNVLLHLRNVNVLAYQSFYITLHGRGCQTLIDEDVPVFPILRGTSVSESGEFSGKVVIICEPKDLERKWDNDSIPILHHDLENYFNENPAALDSLFEEVTAVLAEFGESISQFATYATQHGAIAIVKVEDATHVLEDDMHIRIEAVENQGDVFFID
ncbi:MAG: hypothetical protein ACFFF9_02690 [Candidatus Thorarchaeota archaeon]